MGALPVYWIAKNQLSTITYQHPSPNNPESPISNLQLPITPWTALAFALTYLLSPHLQAANIADFHADPFVVTPLLFAFWYATQRRWGWMWLWAIVVMTTKETLPTLTAMLGLYLIYDYYKINVNPWAKTLDLTLKTERNQTIQNGIVLILASTLWFFISTFLIVSPLAQTYFGTEGPIYLENRYSGGLAGLAPLLQDPARWIYLLGLFTAVGFLPLLAPEFLILGLPVLVANLLSNFPGQYSGEQHYSAPLVVAFIIAAIYGMSRLLNNISLREANGQSLRKSILIGLSFWLLAWSLSYHALHGWTPLSVRVETYQMGPAAAQLETFTRQIPSEAIVSASAAIHPHLAHRRVAYVFPTVEEADYVIVDVTDVPGVHPNDVRTKITTLLDHNWDFVAAKHGLMLAKKGSTASATVTKLPEPFFDFVRTSSPPTYATSLAFGEEQLHLLGYDLLDDPDDGVTFRFYWQANTTLPPDLRLWPLIYDNTGQLLSDPTQVPMIATVWYPPGSWQPNEIVVTETLPQLLPDTFHLGIAVGVAGGFTDLNQHLPIQPIYPEPSNVVEPIIYSSPRLSVGRWTQLATFKRQGPFLEQIPPMLSLQALTPIKAQFGATLQLTGFWIDATRVQPGSQLPLLLLWHAPTLLSTDYTVFIHLLASDGSLVSQSDAFPTWLTPSPTSQWPANYTTLDRHTLPLPDHLSTGSYTLQLGLYHAQTLERLSLADGGDTLILGQIQVE